MKVILVLGNTINRQIENFSLPAIQMSTSFTDNLDLFSKIAIGDKINWLDIWTELDLLKSHSKDFISTFEAIDKYFVCDKIWRNIAKDPILEIHIEYDVIKPTIEFAVCLDLTNIIDTTLGKGASKSIEDHLNIDWNRGEIPQIGDIVNLYSMFPEVFLEGNSSFWSRKEDKEALCDIFNENIVKVTSREFFWENHLKITVDIMN